MAEATAETNQQRHRSRLVQAWSTAALAAAAFTGKLPQLKTLIPEEAEAAPVEKPRTPPAEMIAWFKAQKEIYDRKKAAQAEAEAVKAEQMRAYEENRKKLLGLDG